MAILDNLSLILSKISVKVFNVLVRIYGTQADVYSPNQNTPEGFLAKSFHSETNELYSLKQSNISIIPVPDYSQHYSNFGDDYYDMEIYTDYLEVREGDKLKFKYLGKDYDVKVVAVETIIPVVPDAVQLLKLYCKG